ncbi:MAG: saccharopine dehydrogenase family protein [Candidatus Thorarchaeota archaeon]
MTTYAVSGLGMMGTAIAFDLLLFDLNSKVIGLEFDTYRIEKAKEKLHQFQERFIPILTDITSSNDPKKHPILDILKEYSVSTVFGAIDYKYNFFFSQICIYAQVNYLDLGGNPEVVHQQRKLNSEAEKANIVILPDCGLAPGLANIIAAQRMKHFESVDNCHIRVGGLPQNPKTILNYQQVFSIRGLTNEYLEDAIILHDSKKVVVPSLSDVEELIFPEPWGKLEAFQTSGGTSSLPDIYEGKIKHLTYKTIRFPGHYQFFKFLKDFELLSSDPCPNCPNTNPREIIEYYLEKNLPKNAPDAVLVRISINGIKNGKHIIEQLQLIDLADTHSGFSAMARTTAFPTSIIGQLITKGIISKKGVLMHELVVPEDEFTLELEKRNIKFVIEAKNF